jgi:peptide/histidine transporter 3/4
VQVGSLELFYSQAPDAMRSTCSALQLVATACGNYLAAALVGIVQSISHGSWIADNLNQAHIDYFFILLAVLQVRAGPSGGFNWVEWSVGLALGCPSG